MKNRSELREIIMKVMYQIYILEDAKLEYNLDYLIKEQMESGNQELIQNIRQNLTSGTTGYLEENGERKIIIILR